MRDLQRDIQQTDRIHLGMDLYIYCSNRLSDLGIHCLPRIVVDNHCKDLHNILVSIYMHQLRFFLYTKHLHHKDLLHKDVRLLVEWLLKNIRAKFGIFFFEKKMDGTIVVTSSNDKWTKIRAQYWYSI